MKNNMTTVVSVFLLLWFQFPAGFAGFPSLPCCLYDHDKCTLFEEDGRSVCERSKRVGTQNNGFRELSKDGINSLKLLPEQAEVEFRVATCKPIECDSEDNQNSNSSFFAADTDCDVEIECLVDYQEQSFLFMNIPFQLNGSNITSVDFHINASSPRFDKFIYATRYTVELQGSHRFDFQGENTFHFNGVGTFLKTHTLSEIVAVLPGVSYSVRAHSLNAGSDHVDITVPDCRQLTGALSSNYHCSLKSFATFMSNITIDLAEQPEGVIRVIFKVKTERDWYPSFIVRLRRLPDDEVVKEVDLQNKRESQRGYTAAYPYPHMIHSFRDIAVGTYVVTVQPTIDPDLIDSRQYVYWGGKTSVTRSKEFHLKWPLTTSTVSPESSATATSMPQEPPVMSKEPSSSGFASGTPTSPKEAPPLQESSMSDVESSSKSATDPSTSPTKTPTFQDSSMSDVSSSSGFTTDTWTSPTNSSTFQAAVIYIGIAVVLIFVVALALVFLLLRRCCNKGDDSTTVMTGNPLTLFEPHPLNVDRFTSNYPFCRRTFPESSRSNQSVLSLDEVTVADSLLERVL